MKSLSLIKSPVARRVFFAVLICALLPIGALVGLTFFNAHHQLEKDIGRKLHHACKNIGMALVSELGSLEQGLRQLATVQSGQKGAYRLPTAASLIGEGAIEAIWIIPLTEDFLPNDYPQLSSEVRKRLKTGLPKLQLLQSPALGTEFLLWTQAKNAHSQDIAVVGKINAEYLWHHALGFLPPDATLTLTDRQLRPLIQGDVGFKLTSLGPFKDGSSGHRFVRLEDSGETWLVSMWSLFLRASFDTSSWYVFVREPRDTAFAMLLRFFRNASLASALSFLVILLTSSILIRRTLQPLQLLKEATVTISRGNYSDLPEVESRDEFGDLCIAFQTMSHKIESQIEQREKMTLGVRKVLGSLNKDEIVHGLLASLKGVVSTDIAAVILRDEPSGPQGRCWFTSPHEQYNIEQNCPVTITEEEWGLIQRADGLCRKGSAAEFNQLLAPLLERGFHDFLIFPVVARNTVRGAFVLGGELSSFSAEDGLNSRQLADQLGVALSHSGVVAELDTLNIGILKALARTVDANSRWTHGHSERVTQYALAIGLEMGLSKDELYDLERAGLLHDLGKIAVPSEILNKPGRLTEQEYEVMKRHPAEGARIIEPVRAFDNLRPIVAQHHERWDGKGYPEGLKGEQIHPSARIMAVADVYDALYADRPYREGWSQEEVFTYLRDEAGKAFDPQVVKALFSAIHSVEATAAEWVREVTLEREHGPVRLGEAPLSRSG